MSFGLLIMLAINTLLYPYARFVYENVVDFITGNNVFFVNAVLMMSIKLMTTRSPTGSECHLMLYG